MTGCVLGGGCYCMRQVPVWWCLHRPICEQTTVNTLLFHILQMRAVKTKRPGIKSDQRFFGVKFNDIFYLNICYFLFCINISYLHGGSLVGTGRSQMPYTAWFIACCQARLSLTSGAYSVRNQDFMN